MLLFFNTHLGPCLKLHKFFSSTVKSPALHHILCPFFLPRGVCSLYALRRCFAPQCPILFFWRGALLHVTALRAVRQTLVFLKGGVFFEFEGQHHDVFFFYFHFLDPHSHQANFFSFSKNFLPFFSFLISSILLTFSNLSLYNIFAWVVKAVQKKIVAKMFYIWYTAVAKLKKESL